MVDEFAREKKKNICIKSGERYAGKDLQGNCPIRHVETCPDFLLPLQ
jgi:hypothetical protein